MATDAYDTAKDIMHNNGKNIFDWFKPDMGGDHFDHFENFEFPLWNGNAYEDQGNHHDWFDHGTDHMADMGWPDLNNFDGSDFGHETPSWDHSWGPMPTEPAPSHWDPAPPHWDGHHGSRGIDGEIPADLADHDSWLASLLGSVSF